MNSCDFVGNLVNDPMYYDGETTRVLFTLAVDREGKNREGLKQTDFLDFVAWRSSAEFMHKYCHKGDKIAVQSEARKRTFTNSSGVEVSKVEFQVHSVNIVSKARPKE